MFIIINSNNEIVSYAYNRIDAIGNKEYMERKGMSGLVMKRIYKDTKEYTEITKKIFKNN